MGSPRTLFIVDDTPENLRLLADLLAKEGYCVRKSLSPTFALKSIQQMIPDLILLDINMPEMDGYELCQQLKQNPLTQDIPIIFISAMDNVLDKVKAFRVGGADYIAKPFQVEEIMARIDHQLKLQHQQRQLKREIEEREKAEKALTVSLQVVSHDLRNPVLGLSMVLGQALAQTAVETPTITLERRTVEEMQKSCDRQLALINTLVETHQFERQGVPLVLRPLDLMELIQGVFQGWSGMFAAQGVTVTLTAEDGLPWVLGDSNFLWRVFDNVVNNALKYNPLPRPHPLQLTVTVAMEGSGVICRVADNGVGINPQLGDRIFEPYHRGPSTASTVGLGLGLYVCRQIIQAHGGTIGVASADPGTVIWFTLPIAPDHD